MQSLCGAVWLRYIQIVNSTLLLLDLLCVYSLWSVAYLASMWCLSDLSELPVCIIYLLYHCLIKGLPCIYWIAQKTQHIKGTRNYFQKNLTEFYREEITLLTIADAEEQLNCCRSYQPVSMCCFLHLWDMCFVSACFQLVYCSQQMIIPFHSHIHCARPGVWKGI